MSPALAGRFCTTELPEKPQAGVIICQFSHLKSLRLPEVTCPRSHDQHVPARAALTIQILTALTWESLLLPKGNAGSFQFIKFSLDVRWGNIPLERKRCQKVSGSSK